MNNDTFNFKPSEWLSDQGIRSLSLEARGFLLELICLSASQCTCVSDFTHRELAKLLELDAEHIIELFRELERAGCCKVAFIPEAPETIQ